MRLEYLLVLIMVLGTISISGCVNSDNKDNYLTKSVFEEKILPNLLEYNKTKGKQTPNPPVKGKALLIQNHILSARSEYAPDARLQSYNNDYNVTLNDSVTFFIQLNIDYEGYDVAYYGSKGKEDVKQQRPISDVIVLQWPENKIVGWYRVYGEYPKEIEESLPYGIIASGGADNIDKWIDSLGYNSTVVIWRDKK